MSFIFNIITFIIGLFGVGFAIFNRNAVDVNYIVGSTKLSLAVIIIGTFIAGMLLGMGMGFMRMMKLKVELQWWRYKIASMEKDKEKMQDRMQKEFQAKDNTRQTDDHPPLLK